MGKQKLIFITVFISGLTSLSIEMAASRLMGNVFGTSNLVWASIIGLILIYLALGYYVGGSWADRSPRLGTFYQILIWAAVLIAVIPLVARPVLRAAANAFDQLELGILFGSFAAVMVLFFVPITLLGTASPFAIKLAAAENSGLGRVSGRIYAISTLGSFIGTFLPVLFLVPLLGTYRTFLFSSLLLMLTALVCYTASEGWRVTWRYLWAPLLVVAIWVWGGQGAIKTTPGLVYETESPYNYIQVIEQEQYRLLRLNEGQGVHSIYHPTELNYHGSWEQVLVAPFFNPAPHNLAAVKKIAVVGLAAGTTARQADLVFQLELIDGYEIDPKIVEVGRRFFDMNLPNLQVHVEDGRLGLEKSTIRYDIISVDAYRPPYIPWHMTTVEFFQIVREHLDEDGVLVINVGRGPSDRRLIEALGSTVGTVFPSIYVVDIPNTFNSILFATVVPTHAANLAENLADLSGDPIVHPLLIESMQVAVDNLQPAPAVGVVFTDDHAPIEWITNTMVLDFIVSEDLDTLQ